LAARLDSGHDLFEAGAILKTAQSRTTTFPPQGPALSPSSPAKLLAQRDLPLRYGGCGKQNLG
jgi:hypothetical protein